MEVLATIASIIVSIITIIPTVKNRIFNIKRERKYYKKIIIPYVNELHKSKDLKACSFIKSHFVRTNENIPKYITYLIDINDNEKLHKVLIHDYCFIYKNEKTKTLKFLNNISNIFALFMNLFSIVLLTLGAFLIFMSIASVIVYFTNKDQLILQKFIYYLIYGVLFLPTSLYFFKSVPKISNDIYSLETQNIKKIIDDNVKWYEKNHDKYFI